MTKIEYFKYALKNGLLDKLKWYFSVLSLPATDSFSTDYIKYERGKYTALVDQEWVLLTDTAGAIYGIQDPITLNYSDMECIEKSVDTTIGLAIVNYILLYSNFNSIIPYINGPITVQAIESKLTKLLVDGDITVAMYTNFIDACSYLTNFSRLVSVSATPKNIVPPPGIAEHKVKSLKEMVDKHGADWHKDYTLVKEFENKLTNFDNEWLEDDPSYGKLISGKVKGVGRTKMFLMYGAEAAFDKTGVATTITESLEEGWPADKEKLTNMFNASRAGSYDRGTETQKGGVTAKVVLRATNSVKINPGVDCGSIIGKSVYVNSVNAQYLVGRYTLVNKKPVVITDDNVVGYQGTTITIRSPQYCKLDKNNLCAICVGKKLEDHENGIPLLMTDISSTILAISLAAMHSKELATHKLNITETLN